MNHKPRDEIKEIIARSYSSDSVERQMLEKIFFALADHQENFLKELEGRLVEESNVNDCDKIFEIAAKLIKRDDLEARRGFFPLKNSSDLIFAERDESPFENSRQTKDEIFQATFFLDVRYEDIKNFCEPKRYRGQVVTADGTRKNFSYTLRRHEKFIANEKILFELATLYKIRRPIIFSPYARKAVEIKIDGLDEDELTSLQTFDLMLAENGLSQKLLTDYELCWNVQIENADINHGGELEEYIGADENLIRYEYFHTFDRDTKIFVLPNQHCDNLRVKLSDDERKIIFGYNSLLKERSCKIVRLSDIENLSANTFTNDFPRKNSTLRLRSEGDLEKVLACFNLTRFGKNFPAHFGSLGIVKNSRTITIYRREDRYFIPPENRLLDKFKSKAICCVKFFGDAQSKFKTDYANYVLYYLSQNYPEFTWVGVEA